MTLETTGSNEPIRLAAAILVTADIVF